MCRIVQLGARMVWNANCVLLIRNNHNISNADAHGGAGRYIYMRWLPHMLHNV